jgi:quercetin dioxygenase-like cupin family protein
MDLTIGGQTRRCRAGDSFHIPAGVELGATFLTHLRAIDFFADVDRCQMQA